MHLDFINVHVYLLLFLSNLICINRVEFVSDENVFSGGFGVDFSVDTGSVCAGLCKVASGILQHGVTSFCPTIISSKPEVYKKVHLLLTVTCDVLHLSVFLVVEAV